MTRKRVPFYNPIDSAHSKQWPGFKLLAPVCAVGNVGQLACDLIISTLLSKQECQLVGRIYSPALMPVVGPNAFGRAGPPTTSTEVYESQKHKLVMIQQRTSYFKELKQTYIQEFIQWFKEAKFDQLIVLASSFAQCNPDTSQLALNLEPASCSQPNWLVFGSIKSMTTSSFVGLKKLVELNVKPIPDRRTIKVVQDGLTFLPGSGLTKPLVKACERASIAALFLVDFCSEGININDCYQIANLVDYYLNLGCGPSQTIDLSKLRVSQEGEGERHHPMESSGGGGGDDDECKTAICSWREPLSWSAAQF